MYTPPTADEVANHIRYKMTVRELRQDVGIRMLNLLDDGRPADYQALYEEATRVDLPAVVYHSTSAANRVSILRAGLTAQLPSENRHWANMVFAVAAQPRGVYVAPTPDTDGLWRHDSTIGWDVWAVNTASISNWQHDHLNEDAWVVLGDIPAAALTLHASYDANRKATTA
ncbi:hypothetical protein [Curtobacterium sp. MCBD17_040]|uniref:hypothetical protein n=1 Tax=Curtobacterium sp. MCBD17_040 TaxID=2175674 RepID=UPI000DA8CD8A|nr:hypothetical protein [Curtobacterium sp. MCBD17_040]WIB65812.1 hypothetical protein DEI94_17000 [Curtobacterium sp. MCBD17_040]